MNYLSMRLWAGFTAYALVGADTIAWSAIKSVNSHAAAPCASLRKRYATDMDLAARYMALSDVAQNSKNNSLQSAIESKQSNALARAKIDIDLLKASHCPIPTDAPDAGNYSIEATKCRIRLIVSSIDGIDANAHGGTCDVSAWVGNKAVQQVK